MAFVNEQVFFKKYNIINFSWNRTSSNIIKVGTKSHWGHSGLIVGRNGKNVLVLESLLKTGPTINEYDYEFLIKAWEEKVIEIIDFRIPVTAPESIFRKYMKENPSYGIESIIGIAMAKLGVSTKYDIVGSVICSELVASLVYDLSGKKIKLGYDPKDEDKTSEFNLPYWRIEPKHISLSRYGDRLQLVR